MIFKIAHSPVDWTNNVSVKFGQSLASFRRIPHPHSAICKQSANDHNFK